MVRGGKPALRRGQGGESGMCCIWARSTTASSSRGNAPKAVFDEHPSALRQLSLFPADRTPPSGAAAVQVRLDALRLEHPRQWGACWLGNHLWRALHLDDFFGARLPISREETDWEKVLRILAIYRLLSPGSEWRLHRIWFGTTALGDLLGVDAAAPCRPTRSTVATICSCR